VIRTCLDAGVLIAATRMTGAMGVKALALFNEADRVFVTSDAYRSFKALFTVVSCRRLLARP